MAGFNCCHIVLDKSQQKLTTSCSACVQDPSSRANQGNACSCQGLALQTPFREMKKHGADPRFLLQLFENEGPPPGNFDATQAREGHKGHASGYSAIELCVGVSSVYCRS